MKVAKNFPCVLVALKFTYTRILARSANLWEWPLHTPQITHPVLALCTRPVPAMHSPPQRFAPLLLTELTAAEHDAVFGTHTELRRVTRALREIYLARHVRCKDLVYPCAAGGARDTKVNSHWF